MNAKKLVKRNSEKKTKFFYRDRTEVRITKDVFVNDKQAEGGKRIVHAKGEIKNPHRLLAEQMVLDGYAEYTATSPKKYVPKEIFGRAEKSKS
jgi:hypothetical protein